MNENEKHVRGFMAQEIIRLHYGIWRGLQAQLRGRNWSTAFLTQREWRWDDRGLAGHFWTNGFRSYSALRWAIAQDWKGDES